MSKLFMACLSIAFVLSAGLVSCAPEKKTKQDVYQATAPRIRTKSGEQVLQAWLALKDKQLDLQDTLDLTPAAAARAVVTSHCQIDREEYSQEFKINKPGVLPIFQILPEDILLNDVPNKKISCGFELNLYNEAGSNHIFNLFAVPIVEVHTQPVRVVREPADKDGPHLELTPNQLANIRIRYSNDGPVTAQVICPDATFAELPFNQVIELANFDFKSPLIRPGHSAKMIENFPNQLCRIILASQGRRVAMSDWFRMILPHQSFISTREIGYGPADMTQGLSAIVSGGSANLAQWKISNSSGESRYLRLNKRAVRLNVSIYSTVSGNFIYQSDATRVFPSVNSSIVRDEDDAYTLMIPPGKSTYIEARFQARRRIGCEFRPIGIFVSANQHLTMDEVTETGHVISTEAFDKAFAVVQSLITLDVGNIKVVAGEVACPWL